MKRPDEPDDEATWTLTGIAIIFILCAIAWLAVRP